MSKKLRDDADWRIYLFCVPARRYYSSLFVSYRGERETREDWKGRNRDKCGWRMNVAVPRARMDGSEKKLKLVILCVNILTRWMEHSTTKTGVLSQPLGCWVEQRNSTDSRLWVSHKSMVSRIFGRVLSWSIPNFRGKIFRWKAGISFHFPQKPFGKTRFSQNSGEQNQQNQATRTTSFGNFFRLRRRKRGIPGI